MPTTLYGQLNSYTYSYHKPGTSVFPREQPTAPAHYKFLSNVTNDALSAYLNNGGYPYPYPF